MIESMFFMFFFIFLSSLFGFLMSFSVLLGFLFIIYLLYGGGVGYVDLGLVDCFFFMDFFSFSLVLLTFWCFSVVYLIGVMGVGLFNYYLYFIMLLSLVISFFCSSIYLYYIFFEFSIIPIFFLIVSRGSGQDRLVSSYYMFVYTLLSSLPSLFILMDLYGLFGFGSYNLFNLYGYVIFDIYFVFFMFMFMVKVPIFMFHIWLPKAHVDAPVGGSMVLASIMLKLGGYGIFRVFNMFDINSALLDYFFSIGLVGFVISSVFILFIFDVKVLIAYSSVIHMCMMICGLFSGLSIGWCGGFLMMISHGVCSSCMFMMANMIYFCSGSRCLFYNKGLHGMIPIFSYLWLFLIFFNIGAPPSLSLFSEIYLMAGIMGVDYCYLFLIILGLFFVSCSMINLYNSNNLEWGGVMFEGLSVCNYLSVFFHFFPLIFLVFFVYLFF